MDANSEDEYSDTPSPPAERSKPEDATETALLPRSFFGDKDLEIGKQCKVEIQAIHSDEVEVSYVPHKEPPSKPEPKMAMSEPEPGDDYS